MATIPPPLPVEQPKVVYAWATAITPDESARARPDTVQPITGSSSSSSSSSLADPYGATSATVLDSVLPNNDGVTCGENGAQIGVVLGSEAHSSSGSSLSALPVQPAEEGGAVPAPMVDVGDDEPPAASEKSAAEPSATAAKHCSTTLPPAVEDGPFDSFGVIANGIEEIKLQNATQSGFKKKTVNNKIRERRKFLDSVKSRRERGVLNPKAQELMNMKHPATSQSSQEKDRSTASRDSDDGNTRNKQSQIPTRNAGHGSESEHDCLMHFSRRIPSTEKAPYEPPYGLSPKMTDLTDILAAFVKSLPSYWDPVVRLAEEPSLPSGPPWLANRDLDAGVTIFKVRLLDLPAVNWFCDLYLSEESASKINANLGFDLSSEKFQKEFDDCKGSHRDFIEKAIRMECKDSAIEEEEEEEEEKEKEGEKEKEEDPELSEAFLCAAEHSRVRYNVAKKCELTRCLPYVQAKAAFLRRFTSTKACACTLPVSFHPLLLAFEVSCNYNCTLSAENGLLFVKTSRTINKDEALYISPSLEWFSKLKWRSRRNLILKDGVKCTCARCDGQEDPPFLV